jgi:hypothetical protein
MYEQLRHGLLRVVLVIVVGVAVLVVAISALFWTIGAIFHLVPLAFRLALFVGLVGAVWWLIAGRRRPSRLP